MSIRNIYTKSLLLALPIFSGCKKLIQISPPVGSITTSQVFSSDAQVISAQAGMYYGMINGTTFSNYPITIFCGMSADELEDFNQNPVNSQFFYDNVGINNSIVSGILWGNTYSSVYTANAILDGLANDAGVNDSIKNELTGEAKFVRAFCNFYLVNLFGGVPSVTTIDWRKTMLLSRSPLTDIYQSIISDLKDAQSRLPADFSVGGGQRIIPNRWAATAMLARTYLYLKEYDSAETEASQVINQTGVFSLAPDPNTVFLANSSEAIWQLKQDSSLGLNFNATPEGVQLVPAQLNAGYAPNYIILNDFLQAFEPTDLRRLEWVDSTTYSGATYYFPYKYKMGLGQATDNGSYTEYYMVLRLAEQILIRAEARAQLGEGTWIDDLNSIRRRAGLPPYSGATDQTSALNAIYHERRIELFAEWGHRWLDLKRWNLAVPTLDTIPGKSAINNNFLLYPIPVSEIITDPNLTQNPGYPE